MSVDIKSTGIYYHSTRADRESAARWAQGAARKGVYDGRRNLSVILFDAEEIAEAVAENRLPQAQLILRRDAAYGANDVTISIAPARISDVPGEYMTYRECMDLARREIHKCVSISGSAVVIDLPGAMLMALKAGEANAFLIYKEDDGTDSYCRLSTEATLRLYPDDDWHMPVWLRTISSGDVISSTIISHIAELREIEYYINLRRLHDSMDPMQDIGTGTDLGAYADWPDIIGRMQTAVDEYKVEESQLPVGEDWLEPEAGELPRAEIIEQLRGIIRGDDRLRIVSDPGVTGTIQRALAKVYFDEMRPIPWPEKDQPEAGQRAEPVEGRDVHGQPYYSTVYYNNCCFWIFRRDELVTVTEAAVEIKVTACKGEHNPHVTLYGVRCTENPQENTAYMDIFHADAIGEADCTVGDVTTITLNARALELFNSHTIHGVGINYKNEYVQLAKTAALVMNGSTGQQTQEEEPDE